MAAKAVIVGGGPVGSMLACFLAQKHSHLFPDGIEIYERRKDSRRQSVGDVGRSINLAFSDRSFYAMSQLDKGMVQEIVSLGVKMKGRCIHNKTGTHCAFQRYGKEGQFIVSINRRSLNEWLLTRAERENTKVKIFFSHRALSLDEKCSTVTVWNENKQEELKVEARLIIGADGANSIVRQHLQRTPVARLNYQQTYISHRYKELNIPPTSSNEFAIRPDSLHIWPRGGGCMLIALPNPSKDFTATIFLPHRGENSFEDSLQTDAQVIDFFKGHFPDAYELMKDHLLQDWHRNPVSELMHLCVSQHHYKDRVLLIGDAAHAVVPFFGQGCNCGIEDCRVFSEVLDKEMPTEYSSEKMAKALEEYTALRKPATDAMSALALENWEEMSSRTASKVFLVQKKVGLLLHKIMPRSFVPLYTMVTFSPTMSYKEAYDAQRMRDKLFSVFSKATQRIALIALISFAAFFIAPSVMKNFVKKS